MFRELVDKEIGIHLSPTKHALVNARLLSRVRELGLGTFSEYYERVVGSPETELIRFINAICTNETRFFREPAQFTFIAETLLARLRREAEQGLRDKRLRVWSSACSSGEEPYSLGMLLLDRLPTDWTIEILASDISTKVLERAAHAIYSMERLDEIPLGMRQRFLLRGVGGQAGKFRIAQPVRSLVKFRRANLSSGQFEQLGCFDLILCRNVLMYFKSELRRFVVRQLVRQLSADGHLFVGHSESLHDYDVGLRTVAPTIYRLQRGAR
ncbi:MAG TPA: protein-glutamate O-methyltransferase CheR [Polyangiaceae bacterium]|nr:protein-glutamate O-methyltransferase CheR [Polyangiaceae bacterium]